MKMGITRRFIRRAGGGEKEGDCPEWPTWRAKNRRVTGQGRCALNRPTQFSHAVFLALLGATTGRADVNKGGGE
jgi:hypothetical protein